MEYKDLIDYNDILNVVEKKITVENLKQLKLDKFYRFCKNDEQREEIGQYIEEAFSVIGSFLYSLSYSEFEALTQYGKNIGSTFESINSVLRNNSKMSLVERVTIHALDSAINKFNLNDDITVYRAIKPYDNWNNPDVMVGMVQTDNGYMSTSLSFDKSYSWSDDYSVVLEITVPAGTPCVYLQWFKVAGDEEELLLGRGTTISVDNVRSEIIEEKPRIVYSCTVLQEKLENDKSLK